MLIAEDDRRIREALVDIVTDLGCDVLEARDGAEALELALTRNPDLVLLDVMMPKLDGYQVLRELRVHRETEDMMVIQVTAVPAETGEQEAMKLGVNHNITKSWMAGMVEATVRVALQEVKAIKNPKPKNLSPEPAEETAVEPAAEPDEESEVGVVEFALSPVTSDSDSEQFVTAGGLLRPLQDVLGVGSPEGR